jgi:hypothetical protein
VFVGVRGFALTVLYRRGMLDNPDVLPHSGTEGQGVCHSFHRRSWLGDFSYSRRLKEKVLHSGGTVYRYGHPCELRAA